MKVNFSRVAMATALATMLGTFSQCRNHDLEDRSSAFRGAIWSVASYVLHSTGRIPQLEWNDSAGRQGHYQVGVERDH